MEHPDLALTFDDVLLRVDNECIEPWTYEAITNYEFGLMNFD